MSSSQSNSALIRYSAFDRSMNDYNARESGNLISRGQFNLYLGISLLWGFVINAIVCLLFSQQIIAFASSHIIYFFIGYLVCAFAGIYIANASSNPTVSFLGYNMIVLPLGAVLCLLVSNYPMITVGAAFSATAAVTAVVMVASSIKPEFFLRMGGTLFIALLACIIIEIALTLLGFASSIFDYLIALIFCGYIGFDWARAQSVPPTLDNAVDCACSLYIDIINLFIRLLAIFGRRD